VGPWLIEIRQKTELEPWLAGGPPDRADSIVMLAGGDDETIREFLPNALDAAKKDRGRVVVWLRNPSLLAEGPIAEAFASNGSILAVTLAADGTLAGWVTDDRIGVEDADFAFAQAEKVHA
jgi:hypothetical protein